MSTDRSKLLNSLYQILSLVTQIPVLILILAVILVSSLSLSTTDLFWLKILIINLSIIPILYGSIIFLNKKISDANITIKKERIIPFFVVTLIYGINLLLIFIFEAPSIAKAIALNYFILALALSLITIFWKVSVHVAGITNFALLVSVLIGYNILFFIPPILLTAWVRVKMGCHRPAEVGGGIIIAIIIFYIVLVFQQYLV